MNTILITGTAVVKNNKVGYNVTIWASKEGQQIQYITSTDTLLNSYSELWEYAKNKVSLYFGNDPKINDGAYTQFLDSIVPLPTTSRIQ